MVCEGDPGDRVQNATVIDDHKVIIGVTVPAGGGAMVNIVCIFLGPARRAVSRESERALGTETHFAGYPLWLSVWLWDQRVQKAGE